MLKQIYNKYIAIMLFFLIAAIISGCGKSNEKKKKFIRENIKKVNNKNIKKHNKLIIPDFILDYNEEENTQD